MRRVARGDSDAVLSDDVGIRMLMLVVRTAFAALVLCDRFLRTSDGRQRAATLVRPAGAGSLTEKGNCSSRLSPTLSD